MIAISKILKRIKKDLKPEKKPSYSLQILDHYSAILGAIVSILLSCLAIYLSIQQWKSDRSVEQLTEIVTRFDSLRTNNEQIIIVLLKQQNELIKHSQELSKQTNISTKTFEITEKKDSKETSKETYRLDELLIKFRKKAESVFDKNDVFFKYPAPIKDNIVTNICLILNEIKLNPLVFNMPQILKQIKLVNNMKSNVINSNDAKVYNEFRNSLIYIRDNI